jgi:hypothetical protein
VQSLPQAERPITYITRSYTRERYAPPTIRDADGPEITNSDRAWLDARRTILQRWLARLLPWRR